MSNLASAFTDPEAVARYAEGPRRLVPGLEALHRMARLLLAERAPQEARLLILGAGGGLELKSFAEAQPHWTFDGVDPSAEMLALARQPLAPHLPGITLHEGTLDAAPPGPFHGAACLLTLHFIPAEERRRILTELRRRLHPGAPLITAHFSLPAAPAERTLWLTRYAAFAIDHGVPPENAESARTAIAQHLHILTPEQDEALLQEAGWSGITQFYQGFAFRGWVAYAVNGRRKVARQP